MNIFTRSIIYLFILVVFPMFVFAASDNEEISAMKDALNQGNAEYFKSISYDSLVKANVPNSKGIKKLDRAKYKHTKALLGGFDNSDPRVRAEVYRALTFPYYTQKYKKSPRIVLTRNEEWKGYLDVIVQKTYSTKDVDPPAKDALEELKHVYSFGLSEAIISNYPIGIAVMTAEKFDSENNLGSNSSVISQFGKKSIAILIHVMESPFCSGALKKSIIKELEFIRVGGPEKVIHDIKHDNSVKKGEENRLKKSERLFLLTDKEGDPEIKKLLYNLAVLYYPYK